MEISIDLYRRRRSTRGERCVSRLGRPRRLHHRRRLHIGSRWLQWRVDSRVGSRDI